MTRTTVGCLAWLNEDNRERKFDRFKRSIESMSLIAAQPCDLIIINNGGMSDVGNVVRGLVSGDHKCVDLNKNFYDVAIHFCTMLHALKHENEFMVYLYDDFVVYDDSFLVDCEAFMDAHPSVSCMRLPQYVFNDPKFNTRHTPKIINPEAVRHEDGAGGQKFR